MYNKLILGLLAIQETTAVALNEPTDWTLRRLDKEVGDLKWERPHEKEVFDLASVLGDFYDQVAFNYGGDNYGTYQHHGAYGLDGGNHFEYQDGAPTASFWNPFPSPSGEGDYTVHANEPVAQAYAHGYHADEDGHTPHDMHVAERTKFQYRVPEVHYPDPKPYSYSVTNPSIVYREVEHIAPPAYESPKLRDLAEIETYPEGYTNEYDDYYVENYYGSDGSDHSHFNYDNIDWIDLNHGHFDADPNAKVRPVQPAWDQYFVPVVNGPAFEADYDGDLDPHAEAKSLTYFDAEFGVYRYLFDNSLVPGQAYEAQNGSHHDDYIPGAYTELPDGSVQYYEEEYIPTESYYENDVVVGETTISAVDHEYAGGYPQPSADYPDWLNDALSFH